jgi:hypothetical protein
MTDYLDHLLKRTQSAPAEIRPRPLARFEPVSQEIEPRLEFEDDLSEETFKTTLNLSPRAMVDGMTARDRSAQPGSSSQFFGSQPNTISIPQDSRLSRCRPAARSGC